jgi:hypothetical protein
MKQASIVDFKDAHFKSALLKCVNLKTLSKASNVKTCVVSYYTSCVKLRAATFFLTNLEYSKSVEICDTFITFPPTYKMEINYYEHIEDLIKKVSHQLFNGKTSDEIENIMKAILPMFSSSFKLKSLPGNYDVTRQSPVWIFRNFTNIVFHDVSLDVTFMTAEKWVVPDPILYELLSLPQNADNEESALMRVKNQNCLIPYTLHSTRNPPYF